MEKWIAERIAEKIYELMNKGIPREKIIEKIREFSKKLMGESLDDELIVRAVDQALTSISSNSFHAANKDVLSKLDRADKLSYVGKDGRKYYTRADLAMANEAYINDKYPTTNRVL